MHQPPTKSEKAVIKPAALNITKKTMQNTPTDNHSIAAAGGGGQPPTRNTNPSILSTTGSSEDKPSNNKRQLSSPSEQKEAEYGVQELSTASQDTTSIDEQDGSSTTAPIKRRKLNVSTTSLSGGRIDPPETTTSSSLASNVLPPIHPRPQELSLRKIIPPKDCIRIQGRFDSKNPGKLKEEVRFDWTSVIERAKSHPNEASEPYFGGDISSSTTSQAASAPASQAQGSNTESNHILTYKPLHAMLKYDPPLEAVEAVLRAHPESALDVTFEGTALKIAAESKVSSMLVLRLLLVAEMAMRKKKMLERQQQQQQLEQEESEKQRRREEEEDQARIKEGETQQEQQQQQQQAMGNLKYNSSDEDTPPRKKSTGENTQQQQELQSSTIFSGHNPIRWITERRIPVKTAAMLLKWYPNGAFQRSTVDDIGYTLQHDDNVQMHDDMLDSPLIEIVDDFARDHFDDEGKNVDQTTFEGGYGYDDSETSDWEDNIMGQQPQMTAAATAAAAAVARARPPKSYAQRERQRKERRWEKFLHILYATDLALQSTRTAVRTPSPQTTSVTSQKKSAGSPGTPPTAKQDDSPPMEAPRTPRAIREARAEAAAAAKRASSSSSPQHQQSSPEAAASSNAQPVTPFHPVHAWIRCLTSPHLGLEHCRPYGVWSVLRVMGQRIPAEFTVRDGTDGNRTVFQTLAESKASDCKLCKEEVRDVVECLMEADYRSAFLPRQTDGRLIGHVALENGWPCKDLFSRKTSATCA